MEEKENSIIEILSKLKGRRVNIGVPAIGNKGLFYKIGFLTDIVEKFIELELDNGQLEYIHIEQVRFFRQLLT